MLRLVNLSIFRSITKHLILINLQLIVLLSTIYILFWRNDETRSLLCQPINKEDGLSRSHFESITNRHKTIPFIFVLCGGGKGNGLIMQIRQILNLLKSAAVLTHINLKFILLSDTKKIYQDILMKLESWPMKYQERITLELFPVRYPPGSGYFSKVYRPCATYRLFIPDVFPHIDAAIYLDTDTLFMAPPERMFDLFSEFNEDEAGSLSDDISYERLKKNKYFVGKTGLNSAVILMNLTRLRAAPGGGFTNFTTNIWKKYRDNDQVMINYFFFENPHLVHDLSCEWNYYAYMCTHGRNRCLQAEKYGISLVNGGGDAFFGGRDTTQDIFDAWEEFDFQKPIETLVKNIHWKIANRSLHPAKGRLCTTIKNIAVTFTKRLSVY